MNKSDECSDLMLECCLSVDQLIEQLTLIKSLATKQSITDLKVCVCVPGENGFATAIVSVSYPPVTIGDFPGGTFVMLTACSMKDYKEATQKLYLEPVKDTK